MDLTLALPTFLITLREGVEAALVVGIVLACLGKAGQSNLNRWVYGGIGAGLAASLGIGGLLSLLFVGIQAYPVAAIATPLMKGGFCLLAIGLLSWMLVWMTQQASTAKAEITGNVTTTLRAADTGKNAGWGIAGLIFVAVFREGIETAIFILAQAQQGWLPFLGAVAGLLVATFIGILLFRWGVQINLKRFFQVMGVVLLLIVAGLVVSALKNFEAAALQLSLTLPALANWCASRVGSCLLGPQVWDASQFLPESKFPGILLKTLLGYREHLYLVQAIAYFTFLGSVGTFYFLSLNQPNLNSPSSKQLSS
jgi:high-affinity iron transporter